MKASVMALALVGSIHAADAQEAVLQTQVSVYLPLASCAVPSLALALARELNVPAGIERVPGPCVPVDRTAPRKEISLLGMTLREALDTLVRLDPRYVWLDSGGVAVIRPLDAWNDRHHFLHQTVPSFEFSNRNLLGAERAVQDAMHGRSVQEEQTPMEMRTAQGNQLFSVNLGATSIYAALNEIVRRHGAMAWSISYCQPPASYQTASVMLSTSDGGGIGWHEGGRASPCYRPRPQ